MTRDKNLCGLSASAVNVPSSKALDSRQKPAAMTASHARVSLSGIQLSFAETKITTRLFMFLCVCVVSFSNFYS